MLSPSDDRGTNDASESIGTNKRSEIPEMTVDRLAGLHAQVASMNLRVQSLEMQLFQFRDEVRDEFSGLRRDVVTGDTALRKELREEFAEMALRGCERRHRSSDTAVRGRARKGVGCPAANEMKNRTPRCDRKLPQGRPVCNKN